MPIQPHRTEMPMVSPLRLIREQATIIMDAGHGAIPTMVGMVTSNVWMLLRLSLTI